MLLPLIGDKKNRNPNVDKIQMIIVFWLCASFLSPAFGLCPYRHPKVQVNGGKLQGLCEEQPFGDITTFLGIPYARKPTGNYRFKAPLPAGKWSGTMNASQFGSACIQDNDWLQNEFDDDFYKSNEDCLYLNVYTPGSRNLSDSSLLTNIPVMVWIHGGGFQRGTASLYNPSRLVSVHGVIVVTINYRLGVLGFLSMQKGNYGNFGLRDQTLALHWVQDNIQVFGGDKNVVTLFGHEAGASSILHHLTSRQSKGLFHRAVCQSVMPAGVSTTAKNVTELLAKRLMCGEPDISEMLSCLRSRHVDELLLNANEVTKQSVQPFAKFFVPAIGDNWMPVDPNYNITHGLYNDDINIIMGTSSFEGVTEVYFPLSRKMFELSMDVIAKSLQVTDYSKVAKMILSRYMSKQIGGDYREAYATITNDILTALALDRERKLSSHGSRVFNYRFSHRSSFAQMPFYTAVQHDEFNKFVFGEFTHLTQEEMILSQQIMTAWSQFAKTGTPLFDRRYNLDWLPFKQASGASDSLNEVYIDLNLPLSESSRKTRLKESADIFWNDVVQTFRLRSTTTTDIPTTIPFTGKSTGDSVGKIFRWTNDESDIANLVLIIICGACIVFSCVVGIGHLIYRKRQQERNSMYNVETRNKVNRSSTMSKSVENGQASKPPIEETPT